MVWWKDDHSSKVVLIPNSNKHIIHLYFSTGPFMPEVPKILLTISDTVLTKASFLVISEEHFLLE